MGLIGIVLILGGIAVLGGLVAIGVWFMTKSRREANVPQTPEAYLAQTFDGRPYVVTYGDIPLPDEAAVIAAASARGYRLVQTATVEGQAQPTLYFERVESQGD